VGGNVNLLPYSFRYNSLRSRIELVRDILGESWVEWAEPSTTLKENFLGGSSIAGTNLISEHILRTAFGGGGTVTSLAQRGGGLRLTTGNIADNLTSLNILTFGGGSLAALDPQDDLFFEAKVSLPNAGDLLQSDCFLGFYKDGNNYLGLNYISAGVANKWQAFSVVGGISYNTELGDTVIADQNYNLKIIFSSGEAHLILDETDIYSVSTVTGGLHELLIIISTLDNNAKNADLNFIKLLTNRV